MKVFVDNVIMMNEDIVSTRTIQEYDTIEEAFQKTTTEFIKLCKTLLTDNDIHDIRISKYTPEKPTWSIRYDTMNNNTLEYLSTLRIKED